MENFSDVVFFAVLIATIFGIVLTTYFVKLSRRLMKLIDSMREEVEGRSKEKP